MRFFVGAWWMWKKLAALTLVLLAFWVVASQMTSGPREPMQARSRTELQPPSIAVGSPVAQDAHAAPVRAAVPATTSSHRIAYRGRVIDGATMAPIQGAAVQMTIAPDRHRCVTDSTPRTDASG